MRQKVGRFLPVAATIMAAGVTPGMISFTASKIWFAANSVPPDIGSVNGLYAALCGVAGFVAGNICFALAAPRRTPDFRITPPTSALIGKARDAGIPVASMVVREALTVTIPSCGKRDGAGWVTVIGLEEDGHDRSWLVCYFLTGRRTGPDPLVFIDQLHDDQMVTEQIMSAYRSDEMAWQEKTGDP